LQVITNFINTLSVEEGMGTVEFFIGTLETANLFIAFFIIVFAYLFLKKTHNHHDRKPWELLIAGTIIFLISEILAFVKIVNGWEIVGLRNLLQTLFAALVLFAFTHQHHLLHHQDEIKIHKKKEGVLPPQ
jgi:Ca2+/Na+ antiporter